MYKIGDKVIYNCEEDNYYLKKGEICIIDKLWHYTSPSNISSVMFKVKGNPYWIISEKLISSSILRKLKLEKLKKIL